MPGLTLEPVLVGAILIVFTALLSAVFASRPTTAIPLLLLDVVVSSASIASAVTVGQLRIEAGDVLSLALVAAALMRLQERGVGLHLPRSRSLIALLLVLALSVVRGVVAFGIQSSVANAREILAMLTAAVFFSTVRVTPVVIRALRNWLSLASTVLVVAAATFWFQHGFGTYASTGDRAINSIQALIVLAATIVTILFPPFRGPILRLVVPLTGATVVVLSTQRTVWAAGLVAAAVLVVARRRSYGSTSVVAPRLVVAAAALAVVLLVAAGPPAVTSDLQAGLQRTSSAQGSTFSWRLEGWSALVDRQLAGPVVDLVVGSPAGTGEARVVNGRTDTVAAHSMYVSTLDVVGIVGLVLLLWVYATTLVASRRLLRATPPFVAQAALLFTALLALQLTFFVGYSIGALAGLMVGLAFGFVRGAAHDRPSDRSRHPRFATEV